MRERWRLRRLLRLLGLGLLAAGIWWRYASRRHVLPCPTWLAWLANGPLLNRLLGTEQTLDRMGVRSGMRLLEIGPGPGRLLIPAARRVLPGGEVVGLELQLGMIERLQRRAAEAGITNLDVIHGDATAPGIPLDRFDLVYLSAVLGEIPDREQALRNAYLALKPGGTLAITEILPDPHYQSQQTVRRLAQVAGFTPRDVHGTWRRYTANFVKPEQTSPLTQGSYDE